MSRQFTRNEARAIAAHWRISLDRDFHSLSSDQVDDILSAADAHRYRKPANANGSRARYFHAYLSRCANRPE